MKKPLKKSKNKKKKTRNTGTAVLPATKQHQSQVIQPKLVDLKRTKETKGLFVYDELFEKYHIRVNPECFMVCEYVISKKNGIKRETIHGYHGTMLSALIQMHHLLLSDGCGTSTDLLQVVREFAALLNNIRQK